MEDNIDKLIATEVMRWVEKEGTSSNPIFINELGEEVKNFYPSKNINDALIVLDTICKANNWRAIIDKNINFTEITFKNQLGRYINLNSMGDTFEMAICQIALDSVSIEIESNLSNLKFVL